MLRLSSLILLYATILFISWAQVLLPPVFSPNFYAEITLNSTWRSWWRSYNSNYDKLNKLTIYTQQDGSVRLERNGSRSFETHWLLFIEGHMGAVYFHESSGECSFSGDAAVEKIESALGDIGNIFLSVNSTTGAKPKYNNPEFQCSETSSMKPLYWWDFSKSESLTSERPLLSHHDYMKKPYCKAWCNNITNQQNMLYEGCESMQILADSHGLPRQIDWTNCIYGAYMQLNVEHSYIFHNVSPKPNPASLFVPPIDWGTRCRNINSRIIRTRSTLYSTNIQCDSVGISLSDPPNPKIMNGTVTVTVKECSPSSWCPDCIQASTSVITFDRTDWDIPHTLSFLRQGDGSTRFCFDSNPTQFASTSIEVVGCTRGIAGQGCCYSSSSDCPHWNGSVPTSDTINKCLSLPPLQGTVHTQTDTWYGSQAVNIIQQNANCSKVGIDCDLRYGLKASCSYSGYCDCDGINCASLDINVPKCTFFESNSSTTESTTESITESITESTTKSITNSTHSISKCEARRSSEIKKCGNMVGCNFVACEIDGTFSRKQCHASTGECYCMDTNGNIDQNTFVPAGVPLNCQEFDPSSMSHKFISFSTTLLVGSTLLMV